MGKKQYLCSELKQTDMTKIKFDKHNYRKHSDENKRVIRKSLEECGAGRSVVIDNEGELIAGNGVYEQAKALGIKTRIVETDGTELVVVKRTDLQTDDEKRKRLAMADNAASDNVEWNLPILQADFSADDLAGFGIKVPEIEVNRDNGENGHSGEKIPEAEELLNKAMQDYCREAVERVDICLQYGFLPTMRTPAYARLQFLKAKYYNKKYERNISTIFCPRQFLTSARVKSYYQQMKDSAKHGKSGIAGFRTLTSDGDLSRLFSSGYPIGEGGGRMPLDFPVSLSRKLIAKYANNGRVLDPCHGWGGRLVGALLEEVEEYVGFDPSPVAHEGVCRIYETYKQYQRTKATIIQCPYENAQIDGGFDFALTSPPYFDVEQYDGEQQAHVQYNNYNLWVERFYKPLILDTMARLKDGCCFALQVGSQSYPLKDDAIRIASDAGYAVDIEELDVLQNHTIHDTEEDASECVLVIRKLNLGDLD